MTVGALRSAPATYLLGTRRGLEACASPRGTFAVLALDHRQNLRRELRPDAPQSVTYAEMVEFKRAVIRALAPHATGSLLDPEIGAAQCIADGSLPGRAGLLVAIEATGYEGPPTARVSRVLPGCSSTTTTRRRALKPKNGSWQRWRRPAGPPTCRSSSSPLGSIRRPAAS